MVDKDRFNIGLVLIDLYWDHPDRLPAIPNERESGVDSHTGKE